ncbi:hypothetical protein SF83666_d70080 (plasmid) [Sinorhizobium fredii CCBAU 83666]|nr:hypothetical protein SF83666_d70080 [Sinorhizobium fredii CCBAU 83666]
MLKKANRALKRHFGFSVTASGLCGFFLGAFFGGPIGDAGSASITYLRELLFPPPTALQLDFNAVRGCRQGKLAEIRKSFEDGTIQLSNGAEMLTICDTQSLTTTRAQAPEALSTRFPGCLVWRDHELILTRKSEAVCALPGGNEFICDGAKGQKRGVATVGDPADPVPPCSSETMRRFGFKA